MISVRNLAVPGLEILDMSPGDVWKYVNKIQSSQVVDGPMQARSRVNEGFLVSRFDEDEFLQILSQQQSELYLLTDNNNPLGYGLVSDLKEFCKLIEPTSDGVISGFVRDDMENADYLYQICVMEGVNKKGVGKVLLDWILEGRIRPLVADILVAPVSNTRSINFFQKHGFSSLGYLSLQEYRGYGRLQSEVVKWIP